MDTTTTTTTTANTTSEQWYQSDEGAELLQAIWHNLNDKFNTSQIEVSRAVSSKVLHMVLTTPQHEKVEVLFPKSFPNDAALVVKYKRETKEVVVPYNRNKLNEFPAEVGKILLEAVNGWDRL